LRKKQAELELIRERAERDQREREALETVKTRLEEEKRKVEADLLAERNIAMDKDTLLERSKKREAELEEDVQALQADIDTLDSQLDRAMTAHKASEEKYEALRAAFDEAAEHLARFEQDAEIWRTREAELAGDLTRAESDIQTISAAKEELEKTAEELQHVLSERNEDIARIKERMDIAVADLEAKLAAEVAARYVPLILFSLMLNFSRDLGHSKSEALEKEARQAKEQLAELARTATDYSNMIQKREAEITRIAHDLETCAQERDEFRRECVSLQSSLDTLTRQLDTQKEDHERDAQTHAQLESEIDELRALMDAKISEDGKRAEVERSKEQELNGLRQKVTDLQDQLAETKRQSVALQNKLKVEAESLQTELRSLQTNRADLLQKSKTLEAQRKEAEVVLVNAEKAKRSVESELQSIRSRQIETDGQLAETLKVKEVSVLSWKVNYTYINEIIDLGTSSRCCTYEASKFRGCTPTN